MPQSAFDEAVVALLDAVEHGEGDAFTGAALDVIVQGLGRFLRASFPGLPREDVVDAVDEALLRFIVAAREGKIDRQARPAAYLTTIASHNAVDVLRRQQGEQAVEPEEIEEAVGDDDSFENLDRLLSDRETILTLMQRARDSGQHELNELMQCWLDMDFAGQKPTLRDLGAHLQISHTEVRRRLDRLAQLS
jgi:hypothetical protein